MNILTSMSGYIKYFENGAKNMSFIIKDDDVLDKYNKIWNKIKKDLNVRLHSMPVYDKKYMKGKVRKFKGVIKKNFLGDEVSNKNVHYTCMTSITIDSVMKIEKKKELSTRM